ncbi:hypothetical protein GCM10010302_37170 [Streptomyces polychromogenes]|uniref:ATP-grasp domain-containing protein n=1 Tax=Streptomyces polychromogenes TaxID=67342 RepID=A0ABN0VF51_9ACTN
MSDSQTAQRARRALLVMPGPGLVRAARAAGLEVWAALDHRLEVERGVREELPPERILRVDFADAAALRAVLTDTARHHGIGHVLYLPGALTGGAPDAAEAVARELARERREREGAVPGLPDAAAMRRVLNASGISAVRAEEAATVAEARALAEAFPLPVVIKSADASGAWHTTPVRDHEALADWAGRAVVGRYPGPHLVEELLTGPRFSVETFSVGGMHLVAGITAEGHAQPLSEEDRAGVRATVRALLDLAGYESGTTRTDVLITARGSRIAAAREPYGNPARRPEEEVEPV